MPQKRTRLRRKASSAWVVPEMQKKKMLKLASETEDKMLEIMEINNKIQANMETMKQYFEQYGEKELPAEYGNFGLETPTGRSSTVIHVAEFKEKVTEEEFMESVTVGVTKAKDVLSKKELADCSTTTPGKTGDPIVKYAKKKKK